MSDESSPPVQPHDPPTVAQALGQLRVDAAIMLLGAGLVIIGSLGPWATSPLTSADGTSGDGVITLVAGVVIGAAALLTRGWRLATLAILVAGAVGVYDFVHLHNDLRTATFAGVQIDHVGWGLYVVIVGAVVAFGGAIKRGEFRGTPPTSD